MPERASQYRKKPRQQRSQATVDALLKATAQLLEERGYARLTTNHIARRAGVSIGSLYQYFPGKDALCHALAERHFGNYAQRYLARLEAVAQTPLETQVRELVRLNFEIAREDPGMARALYHELSRIGGHDPLQRTRTAVIQALESRYRALPAAWRLAHPDMTAFIVTVACGALVGEIVMYRPEWLHDDAFIEQVTQLVLGYYQRLGWQPARQDSRKHG